jgi:ABC-2 type transport system permease protein
MIQQVLTIGRNAFLESIRQSVFVVLLLGTMLALFFCLTLSGYTFDNDNNLLRDMGLSTLLMAGLFLAGFTAAGVVGREIASRTVLTVVSKPVARPLFILGKYLGLSAALALAFWIMSVNFLLTMRHGVLAMATDKVDQPVVVFGLLAVALSLGIAVLGNYLYRWVFTSSFVLSLGALATLALGLVLLVGKEWHIQTPAAEWGKDGVLVGGQTLIALVMAFEVILVITAVATAASTRLGQVMTLVIAGGTLLLGLTTGWIHAHAGQRAAAARLVYWIVPNVEFFWQSEALAQGHTVPLSHLGLVSLYSLLQIGAMLCLAITLFQSREVG